MKHPLPPAAPADDGAPGREWWRGADVRDELQNAWVGVRDELQDVWTVHGRGGLQAAYEIGAQIGDVVGARLDQLPDPYAVGQQRGLDLRWLRLGLTVPALVLSLLVTWGGQSPADRMARYVARGGLLAPLGWVLLPALALAVLMVLPLGGGLVSAAVRGVAALLRQAWAFPYLGYVLRLAVAVAGWSFVVAAGRLTWRAVINWLTGV
ncbi:hypothetical protein [Actinacidiphila sp. ITFR-21]|uniref:hypothetical protein n=1 Tax=Actinacidiphila sp. ITFR-21 TaxID=3075199 RepID=UPI00288C3BEA|nr:hypothetical protein [Streptomyces sp. ITFR-21]WNI19940.1 hypothetical protein RLT57_30835 [Streptomyces sp. ITFR-21]